MTKQETQQIAKSFYDGACEQQNVGHYACLLNTVGDDAFMTELFSVRGFKELLQAALPPEQHKVGHLGSAK